MSQPSASRGAEAAPDGSLCSELNWVCFFNLAANMKSLTKTLTHQQPDLPPPPPPPLRQLGVSKAAGSVPFGDVIVQDLWVLESKYFTSLASAPGRKECGEFII